MEKLRYHCQKILPLVYDDSLSYYEFLCKICNKVNSIIEYLDNNLFGNISITYNAETETIEFANGGN